jgi:hypothetical protein
VVELPTPHDIGCDEPPPPPLIVVEPLPLPSLVELLVEPDELSDEPVAGQKYPIGQIVTLLPPLQYEPATQLVHALPAPATPKKPPAHVQSSDDELPTDEVRLSPHDWGVGVPVGQYEPVGHCVGDEPFPLQFNPATHDVQGKFAPFTPNSPAIQWQSLAEAAPTSEVRLLPHDIGWDEPPPLLLLELSVSLVELVDEPSDESDDAGQK